LSLPMAAEKPHKRATEEKEGYEQFFKDRMKTFAGFQMDFKPVNTFDETPEQREAFFEELWQKGGFHFWLVVY
jgi:hypothetical protein